MLCIRDVPFFVLVRCRILETCAILCTCKVLCTRDVPFFVLVRCRILEICAILYTCKVLSTRDQRHIVHYCLFTVSIYIGATSVGCLLSGIMMDLWGRRLAVQIAISSVCIGWLLIAISATYPLMLVGRALCGFGKGFATPAVIVSYKHVQPRHVESVKNIHTAI